MKIHRMTFATSRPLCFVSGLHRNPNKNLHLSKKMFNVCVHLALMKPGRRNLNLNPRLKLSEHWLIKDFDCVFGGVKERHNKTDFLNIQIKKKGYSKIKQKLHMKRKER